MWLMSEVNSVAKFATQIHTIVTGKLSGEFKKRITLTLPDIDRDLRFAVLGNQIRNTMRVTLRRKINETKETT